jgi:DNA-binding LacI/PurR family transcriptional regulator
MPNNSNRPTLRDVARRAGVSYQTVSRVINGQSGVGAETRESVLVVMREMKYQPNRAAQMLATQRSHTVEVVTIYPRSRVLYDSLETMAATCWKSHYRLVFTVVERAEFKHYLETASARLVDGMILLAPHWVLGMTEDELMDACGDIPFVQMMTHPGSTLPSVIYDLRYGAKVAVEHLIELGHQHIAEIRGPLDSFEADIRHAGWQETLEAHGLGPCPFVAGKTFQVESGYQAAQELLGKEQPFTALYTNNDRLALGAIHAFYERGLRVPDDISVIGYDNIEHGAHSIPPLTTVTVDHSHNARLAVEYLIRLMENDETPVEQIILYPELCIRSSTRSVKIS